MGANRLSSEPKRFFGEKAGVIPAAPTTVPYTTNQGGKMHHDSIIRLKELIRLERAIFLLKEALAALDTTTENYFLVHQTIQKMELEAKELKSALGCS